MSSLVRQMIGEFTGAGDVAPVMVSTPPRVAKPPLKRRRRRLVREADSLIPKDAEAIDDVGGLDGGLEGEAETEDEGHEDASQLPNAAELLHPALALVAPDCTPDATKPLDAARVPKPAIPATPAAPTDDGIGVLKLFTGVSRGGHPTVPPVSTATPRAESMPHQVAPIVPISEEQLKGQAMPSHVNTNGAATKATLKRFNFTG